MIRIPTTKEQFEEDMKKEAPITERLFKEEAAKMRKVGNIEAAERLERLAKWVIETYG